MLGVRCASRKKKKEKKKLVCWLRFQDFHSGPGETRRDKYSDIHSEVRGQHVCRKRSCYTHTHTKKYAHRHTMSLEAFILLAWTLTHSRHRPVDKVSSLAGRSTLGSCFSLQELPERRPGSPLSSPPSSLPLWEYHAASSTRAPGSGPSVTARLTSGGQVSQTDPGQEGGSGSGTSDPDPMNALLQTWRIRICISDSLLLQTT